MRGRDVLIHIALLPVTLAVAGTLIGLVWSIVRAGSRPGWLGTRRPMLDGFNEGWIDFGGGAIAEPHRPDPLDAVLKDLAAKLTSNS